MKYLLLALSALLTSGCSNPFSKQQPIQIQQTKNAVCNQIDFRQETLEVAQLRLIVDCLNSGHQIEGFSKLLTTLTDAEISPFIEVFNQNAKTNPKLFFAVKEFYLHLKNSGKMDEVNALIYLLFHDSKKNENISNILKQHSIEFTKAILDTKISIDISSLYFITKSPSFIRIVTENNTQAFWTDFITSSQQYLSDSSSLPLNEVVNALFDTSFFDSLKGTTSVNGETNLRKTASFIEWLFLDGRLVKLSQQLREFQNTTVSCMNGNLPLERPDLYLANKLAGLSANEAKEYLQHQSKSLVLLSHGFCETPKIFEELVTSLSELSTHPGFENFFSLFKGILTNEKLLRWVASPSFENLVHKNSKLAQTHFFYDLLTILNQTAQLPVVKDGFNEIITGIDFALRNFNQNELSSLIEFLQPIFVKEEKYGNHFVSLIYSEFSKFPAFSFATVLSKNDLEITLSAILRSEKLVDTLNTVQLITKNGLLQSILDDTLNIFSTFISRGTYPIRFETVVLPEFPKFNFQTFLLERYIFSASTDQCLTMSLTWNTDHIANYFNCLDPNQTLPKTKQATEFTLERGYFSILTDWKNLFSNSGLSSHLLSFYQFIHDFFVLPKNAVNELIKATKLGANFLSNWLPPEVQLNEAKKNIGEVATSNLTFEAINELLSKNLDQYVSQSSSPRFDLKNEKLIDLRLDSDELFSKITFKEAVIKTMDRFCANRDITSSGCDIDDDQVKLFLKSPDLLVEQVKNEYLNSPSNWIHPHSFPKKWNHVTSKDPILTSDFETHFYPLLHLIKNNPQSVQSTVDFLSFFHLKKDESVNYEHHYPESRLMDFIISKSTHLTMMPYIYQLNRNPNANGQEYHNRIRIRLVSDLGQIELMAINTDFIFIPAKYPMIESILRRYDILLGNTGMRLSSEVGFAMGDLPKDAWPRGLGKYKDLVRCDPSEKTGNEHCVRTYEQVKQMMYQQINLFDTAVLRGFGNCDSRSVIRSGTCIPELYDVNARVFNLKRLLRFMDAGGGDIVRDIFYSTHTASASGSLNIFPDGMKLDAACRKNPLSAQPNKCIYDNLELATIISRLGLLHEIALSVINHKDSAILKLFNILLQIQNRSPELAEKIVSFLNSNAGIKTALEISDASFALQKSYTNSEKDRLNSVVTSALSIAENISDQSWAEFILLIVKNNPKIFFENLGFVKELTSVFLESNSKSFSLSAYLEQNQNGAVRRWVDLASSKLTPELAIEVSEILPKLRLNQGKWLPPLHDLKQIQFSESWNGLKPAALKLSSELARYPVDFDRSKFTDEFCTVFSDATWVNQSADALQEIHQNSNTLPLFEDIGKMLNLSH